MLSVGGRLLGESMAAECGSRATITLVMESARVDWRRLEGEEGPARASWRGKGGRERDLDLVFLANGREEPGWRAMARRDGEVSAGEEGDDMVSVRRVAVAAVLR
jgi:hypothetical protein